MKLRIHLSAALLALLSPIFTASAESSVGKVLTPKEGVEIKILELRRTGDRAVMLRYAATNTGTQELSGSSLGFHNEYAHLGLAEVAFIDMQDRKKFYCMKSGGSCEGSQKTKLLPGKTQEFWVYMTEPPAATSSVLLQFGDSVPQRVTIDPAQ